MINQQLVFWLIFVRINNINLQTIIMGVFGLWDILMTTAKRIPIQQLSGKVLAIDASIWLVKADSIFAQDHQKIKCILDKVLFMKKNNILPIFVFDGVPPMIKRKTLEKRRRRRLQQGSQVQVRKKTEIQIMHLLQDKSNSKRQFVQNTKLKRHEQVEKNLEEINKIYSNLNSFQQNQSALDEEKLKKIILQSDVLNYKYYLLIQEQKIDVEKCVSLEDFRQFDIDQKVEYLQTVQREIWTSQLRKNKIKELRIENQNLTPQQKILNQMKKIQKKTKLRELQDNLYRDGLKNVTTQQNGYEIIQQVRNGRKRIQKRKIQTNNNQQEYFGRKIKKEKNTCFADMYSKDPNQKSQFYADEYGIDGEPDPFLTDLFSKKHEQNVSKRQSQEHLIQVPKIPVNANKSRKEQTKPKKNINLKVHLSLGDEADDSKNIQSSDEQEYFQNTIPIQQKRQNSSQSKSKSGNINASSQKNSRMRQSQQQNKEQLPKFINYRNLSLQNFNNQCERNVQFQKILDMMGIPYIVSPSEAEAQCAALQLEGLVDGVITQDSDVFLFGAKNVFRGVFQNNIKFFNTQTIQSKVFLNREKMIIFALLLGSDYTDGVKGIGIVNAMQILKIFDNFQKLQQFKKWARYADILQADPQCKTQNILSQVSQQQTKQFYQLHKKYKNYWYMTDDFPKPGVIQAYLNPEVIDQARITQIKQTHFFKPKEPNLQILKVFFKQKLNLTTLQIQLNIKMLKKQFKKDSQTKITDFANFQTSNLAVIKSKRLLKALQKQKPQYDKFQQEQQNQYSDIQE